MRVRNLDALGPAPTRVVIINAGTDIVATRALFSAIANAQLPVLLINRSPSPRSTRHFDALLEHHDFDILDAEGGHHGRFLDELFRRSSDGSILLLDSDAELRDPRLVPWMLRMLETPNTFGAGYLEGPFWLDEDWRAPPESMLYMERPWVPLLLLRVTHVRRALDAGRRFGELLIPNEVAFLPRAAWVLAARFGPPYGPHSRTLERLPRPVRNWVSERRLDSLRWSRYPYYGLRPKIACYDTASRIYEYLRFEEGLIFAGIDVRLSEGRVHHYGGITRNATYGATKLDRSETEVADDAKHCLKEHYGFIWTEP